MTEIGLFWLAGLLEAKGCFSWARTTPTVTLARPDKDVVERAAKLMHGRCLGPRRYGREPIYRVAVHGDRALSIMNRVWPLMGERNRGRITEVLERERKRRIENYMQQEAITLEAKLCISVEAPCALCGQQKARSVGRSETYLARSESWVCYDCARQADPDLADFAYHPERYVRPEIGLTPSSPDGTCPECLEAGWLIALDPDIWLACPRHGLKWVTRRDKERVSLSRMLPHADLSRYREVTPTEWARLDSLVAKLTTLRALAIKATNNTLVELTDHAIATRDLVELEAVKQLYVDEFGREELLALGVEPF